MKRKAVILACVVALLTAETPVFANEGEGSAETAAVAADIIVVRPFCLVATILGSVVWVVGLPVAATSKSVRRSAHALVVRPAKATFTRPLGDLDALNYD